jgi:hypothetical protein
MRLVPVAMRNDGSDHTTQCSVDYERMKLVSVGLAETDLDDDDEKPKRKYRGDDAEPVKPRKTKDGHDQELDDRRKLMRGAKRRDDTSVVLG